ncbi:MAG: ABC transporter ATP-binding protein/permease [Chromatiaceae bacterium]|nr:ABC transporter ATP-binding protein/permease [Chromatiaceae bacterium]
MTPHKAVLTLGLCLLLGQAAASLVIPRLAGQFTDGILAGAAIGNILLAWLGVVALQSGLTFASSYLLGRAGVEIIARLSERLYDHLQAIPLAWFHERKRGEVLALLTNDVQRISTFVTGTLVRLLPQLVTFFGALLLIYFVDAGIAFVMLIGLPLFFLLLKLATRSLRPLTDQLMRSQAGQVAIAEQNLGLLPVIKSFVREDLESERFRNTTRRVLNLQKRYLLIVQLLSPVTRIVLTAALVVVLWLASGKLIAGDMETGDLVSLLLYGSLMSVPLASLTNIYGEVQSVRGAGTRLLEVFAEQPEPYEGGKPELPPVRGEIRIEGLHFRYPRRAEVLTDLHLRVDAGETVAFTGPNGAGKSTLAHLLLRLIDPQRGRIYIDETDIAEVDLLSLRRQIGLVDQNTLLFNGTVAENIAYGRFEASPQEVEGAAKAAHAHDFIERLPRGYDTLIGDQGIKLSGGQKQRVALARALLKDPAILILDEATSMFDPEGERGFIRECRDLLHSRTVLMITHRPESLKLAQRIFRLDGGKLREVEAHAQPTALRTT